MTILFAFILAPIRFVLLSIFFVIYALATLPVRLCTSEHFTLFRADRIAARVVLFFLGFLTIKTQRVCVWPSMFQAFSVFFCLQFSPVAFQSFSPRPVSTPSGGAVGSMRACLLSHLAVHSINHRCMSHVALRPLHPSGGRHASLSLRCGPCCHRRSLSGKLMQSQPACRQSVYWCYRIGVSLLHLRFLGGRRHH